MNQQEIETTNKIKAQIAVEKTKLEALDKVYNSTNNNDVMTEVLEHIDYHHENIYFLGKQLP